MVRLSVVVPATNAPATLSRCLTALYAAVGDEDEVLVSAEPPGGGPAQARNAGARRAVNDVIVFVDADVEVHPDALRRIGSAFEADPELVALFGSYDDRPAAVGTVSTFRNLLHHHVHQTAVGPWTTFWAGLGAIRRDAFVAIGGFDESFAKPSIEDIELGGRLAAAGAKIVLDPRVQGTHLKRWTLTEMVRTDFSRRGVPWVLLLLRNRSSSTTLNLGWRYRASAVAALLVCLGVIRRRPLPTFAGAATLAALNASFYALLARRQGLPRAAVGLGLHTIHHATAVAAVPAAVLAHLTRHR